MNFSNFLLLSAALVAVDLPVLRVLLLVHWQVGLGGSPLGAQTTVLVGLVIIIIFVLKQLRRHVVQVIEVQVVEETLQVNALPVQLHEELLRVGPRLSAGSSLDVQLHLLPVLAEELEGFQESAVLELTPSALVVVHLRRSEGRRHQVVLAISQTVELLDHLLFAVGLLLGLGGLGVEVRHLLGSQ